MRNYTFPISRIDNKIEKYFFRIKYFEKKCIIRNIFYLTISIYTLHLETTGSPVVLALIEVS